MPAAHEVLIVCEGYQDRHFWDGWLRRLGWREDTSVVMRRRNREPPGQYGFRHAAGSLRLAPAGGKSLVFVAAIDLLRAEPDVTHLVLNEDPDQLAMTRTPELPLPLRATRERLEALGWSCGPVADYPLLVTHPDRAPVAIHRILWTCADPPAPGLPAVDTLERLVCAALLAAYPDRGPVVQAFLDARPAPPADHPHKAAAMSHMAGWYAPHGSFDFYRHLWDDPLLADQLELRLRASGAWAIAESLGTP